MSEWPPNMSGYNFDQSNAHDYCDIDASYDGSHYYGYHNQSQPAFHHSAHPPPAKSARSEFDHGPGVGARSFADATAGHQTAADSLTTVIYPHHPQPSALGGSAYLPPASHNQYSELREQRDNVPDYSSVSTYRQSGENEYQYSSFYPSDYHNTNLNIRNQYHDISRPPPTSSYLKSLAAGTRDFTVQSSCLRELPPYRKPDNYRLANQFDGRLANDVSRENPMRSLESGPLAPRNHLPRASLCFDKTLTKRLDEAKSEWNGNRYTHPNEFGRKRSGSPSFFNNTYSRAQRATNDRDAGFNSTRGTSSRYASLQEAGNGWNCHATRGIRIGMRRSSTVSSDIGPKNRIAPPLWSRGPRGLINDGPMNAIRPSPANYISCGEEPMSLLDATFAPPAGLPMLAKRERSVTRWAKAVRKEWPVYARRSGESNKNLETVSIGCNNSLQFTSFLSDVLQRELRKNMTFVYGTLRDVAVGDRGMRGEFYPGEADETSVLVDLYYDDVFVAHGFGAERVDAREKASHNALQLFLRDRVFVVGCYRLWEGELIPSFCVSNSRQPPPRLPPYPRNPKRERATSDKPDSKTLPWLQVNPSSKMDTSARLKPKSMKDFFILINGRGDDFSESEEKSYDFLSGFPKTLNSVAVMNNSAQFNQMKVEYRLDSTPNGTHRCTVVLDKQEVGEGVGRDANQARRVACETVLNVLSKNQPVVRMQLDKAQVITRSQLDGWAMKLSDEQPDWVVAMDAKLDPSNPMKEPHLQKVMDDAEAFLKQYIHEERQEPLKFGSEFTHDERMAIHKAARRLGLASKPYGPQWRLYQVVSLRFSLDALKRILLTKAVAGRYALVSPGTIDLSHLTEESTDGRSASEGVPETEAPNPTEPEPSDAEDGAGSRNQT